ncbi:MAG: dihydropteroate synthase [Candidatus Cloacimonadota bacterium]|nr:MAG: dihydropteroate synthase [Candidatus Cloacimonadota bacterium]
MNRILSIKNIDQAHAELAKIKVSSQGIEVMAPKCLGLSIKLTDVHIGAANILKQEMLSIGGDAAVARGVVNGVEKTSDVILLGNADKIKKLIKKLDHQSIFGLTEIRKALKRLISVPLQNTTHHFSIGSSTMDFSQTRIMGILNVTPDSFSDGNKYLSVNEAVDHALQMVEDGADIIDVGGESTRPGAQKIDIQAELDRVIPVIEKIRKNSSIPISIDTYKSQVAEQAISVGANIINDVSALRFDKKMIELLKKNNKIPIIMMHMLGTPQTMQVEPYYDDVIEEILVFFEERLKFCRSNGIELDRIILDPGIGFGKRQQDNLQILNKLSEFKCFGVPVLLGASRKSFIGRIYDSNSEDRLAGSMAATALACEAGLQIVRVHDVKEQRRFLEVLKSVRKL